jgi:hypothetical protein
LLLRNSARFAKGNFGAVTAPTASEPVACMRSTLIALEVAATVTQPKNSIEIAKEFSTKTRGVRPPKMLQTDDGEIIADAKWPGMYRVKWRDGGVSDMVNYVRAKWLLIDAE